MKIHFHEVNTLESSKRPEWSQDASVFAILLPQPVEKLSIVLDVCYDFLVELPFVTPFICAGEEMKGLHRIKTDIGICLIIAVHGTGNITLEWFISNISRT
jgi:hypothetical protein